MPVIEKRGEIGVDQNKAAPMLHLEFGHTRLGVYRIFVADRSGNIIFSGDGNNADDRPDVFAISGSVAAAKKLRVIVVAHIEPLHDPAGSWNVRATVMQGSDDAGHLEATGSGGAQLVVLDITLH